MCEKWQGWRYIICCMHLYQEELASHHSTDKHNGVILNIAPTTLDFKIIPWYGRPPSNQHLHSSWQAHTYMYITTYTDTELFSSQVTLSTSVVNPLACTCIPCHKSLNHGLLPLEFRPSSLVQAGDVHLQRCVLLLQLLILKSLIMSNMHINYYTYM